MITTVDAYTAPAAPASLRPFDVRRDLGSVADLIELCFADTLDADGERYIQRMRTAAGNPSLLRWASVSSEWGNSTMTGYVWEEAGRLVGNLSLIPYAVNGRRRFLIANVAVHPEYRRRGIARRLTEKGIEHARRRGVAEVWLHVREENDAAVSLYQSLNFIERTRRTSWYGQSDYPRQVAFPSLSLGPRRNQDWASQRRWLERNYPPEVTWHLQFRLGALRPGLLGFLNQLGGNIQVQQWSARKERELLAAASWQSMNAYVGTLWLAAPLDGDEEAVQSLLIHARRQIPSRRPISIDYPAHEFSQAFQAAGFAEHQTLIWMSISFNQN